MESKCEVIDGIETFYLRLSKEEIQTIWLGFETYVARTEKEVEKQIEKFNSGKFNFQAEIRQVQENVIGMHKDRDLCNKLFLAFNPQLNTEEV